MSSNGPVAFAPAAPRPTRWETVRAAVMFGLSFVYLFLTAGLIHRASTTSITRIEQDILFAGPLVLWPVFAAEAMWNYRRRDRTRSRWAALRRVLLVWLMPPWRMALVDPRTGLVWFPFWGWCEPGKELFKRLEKVFSGPMLLFAFLILPILIVEYVKSEQVQANPLLALGLDIGIAVVWVAFATELICKTSVHPKPWQFLRQSWLDVAIVVLPMLEFVLFHWVDAAPLARLVRLSRAISPEQIARMQKLYRLQGLLIKAWHALLLIESVARLLGITPEKRLAKVEQQIAELQEELAELHRLADELRAKIAAAQNPPEVGSGGEGGQPVGAVVTASSRPSVP